MTSQVNSAQSATDAAVDDMATEGQAQERVYTQAEFDSAMAKMRTAVERRAVKPYQDLGSPEELRALKATFENQTQPQAAAKPNDFDQVLKEIVSKKDAEIARRDQMIAQYRVDAPLTDAAARYRSVNPEQVKALLREKVRVNTEGEVEVLDEHGRVRYSDNGDLLNVDQLVKTFLDTNPHFVQATPATTNSRTSMGLQAATQIDVSQLDMKNPAHRKLYADHKKQQGLRS
jgi:hypothetical protein